MLKDYINIHLTEFIEFNNSQDDRSRGLKDLQRKMKQEKGHHGLVM